MISGNSIYLSGTASRRWFHWQVRPSPPDTSSKRKRPPVVQSFGLGYRQKGEFCFVVSGSTEIKDLVGSWGLGSQDYL